MTTKEKILKKALELFNRDGTSKVSTHHIADSMKISPGNLYYHYENKNEIIREIGENMITEMNELMKLKITNVLNPVKMFTNLFQKLFQIQVDYAFLFNETVILINNDLLFKKRSDEARRNWMNFHENLILKLIELKILKHKNLKEYRTLIQTQWLILNFWRNHSQLEGIKFDDKRIKEGILLVFTLAEPYLTPLGKVTFSKIKKNLET
jgi:AcrR family transcriptional regulator